MRRRSLIWHIFPPFLAIIILTLVLVTGFSSSALRRHQFDVAARDLTARAQLLIGQIRPLVADRRDAEVQALCRQIGTTTDTRFTVVLADGTVIGDSHDDPKRMGNHGDRPEIRKALAGEIGRSERFSHTLQNTRLYVAVPFALAGDRPAGVVRTSFAVDDINATLRQVFWQMALGGLILAVLAAAVSYLVSRRLSAPLKRLKSGAERFAGGRFDVRLEVPDSEEIGALADAMNRMAAQLHDRLATVEKQRNEMEAVLSSMVEGVLAIDTDETVLGLNRAGARLLGLDPERALGRSIQEVVRNPDLLALAQGALHGAESVEGDIVLSREDESYLQVHATGLEGANGQRLGALLVLNDVTRLRRLENMRRDFVANVSHELRTPITSVKGFVETLMENPPEDPDEARRFLEIIHAQAERLNAIISDLLSLSRIEQEANEATIGFRETRLSDALDAAVVACTAKAGGLAERVKVECPPDLRALTNPPLLEQAVVNLVDNALKYSEADKPVLIAARLRDGAVEIAVSDRGRGIEAKHLPRLFERFYRVDRARSRKLGGTGLGLAIVKHIVQAHAGEVRVESEPGVGSTFTIVLPHSAVGEPEDRG